MDNTPPKKRKVGIITFHNEYNCGAALQAYALQEIIKNLGYETLILNYYFEDAMREYDIRWGSSLSVVAHDILITPKRISQHRSFKDFHKTFFKELSPLIKDNKDLKYASSECSRLVCGSDQIWNPNFGEIFYPFFLQFATSYQRKVAYAPCVNADRLNERYEGKYIELLSDFYAVSTRDEKIAKQLSKLLNRNVPCVLDPVLLHPMVKYDELLSEYRGPDFSHRYVFVYCLNHTRLAEMLRIAEQFAEERQMKIVYFAKISRIGNRYMKNIFKYGPLAFVFAIKNADYVFSDSFHACAFSIIYKKQFAFNYNNIRITELLTKIGMKNRLIDDSFSLDEKIEYDSVYRNLNRLRDESLDYLRKALE